MRARWMVAAGIVILWLGASGATANGVDVLDAMEGTVTTLEDAISAGRTGGADSTGIRKAEKARDSLEEAIRGLRAHEMRTFRRYFEKGVKRLEKAEDRLGAAYLDPTGSAALVGTVRGCLVSARGIVDDQIGIGPRYAAKADRDLAKGDAKAAAGKWSSAAERYLRGLSRLEEVPIPVVGTHRSIRLRALNGALMNIAIAVVPYSPRQTCGICHDNDQIVAAYHFDQGRDVISDTYSVGKDVPDYVLSDGMFGRW